MKFRYRKKRASSNVKNKFKVGDVYLHVDMHDDEPDVLVRHAGTFFDKRTELYYHSFICPRRGTWILTLGAWHEWSAGMIHQVCK